MAELSLKGLNKSFGAVDVIRDVNLEIANGEFVVFVGPSGCGKSTLLRIISGLEEPTLGQVSIGGQDVTDHDPSDRGVAMVFQSYALYPHMNVEQNLGFGLRMGGMPRPEVASRVADAARILGLEDLMDRKPRALSGGQRQRVAIGRAIVRNPGVFLFDEPLSNLDAELRVQMRVEIAKLQKDLGVTMVYVTHDQVEAMTLADRIVVLRDGRIEQEGMPINLYDDPNSEFVAGFIGSPKMNLLPAEAKRVDGKLVEIQVEGFPQSTIKLKTRAGDAKAGDKVTFGVRPEHFIDPTVADAHFEARAQVVEQLGGVSYIYADGIGDTRITVQEKGHSTVPAGTEVRFGIDPATCFLFAEGGRRI